MKKTFIWILALVICLSLVACGTSTEKAAAPAESAPPATEKSPETQPPQSEPFNGQQIRIGDKVYDRLLRALMEQTDAEVTVVLESDLLMTGSSIILGSSDYGGLFQGNTVTITPTNLTIDLNGFTITGEENLPIFEVQSGYTLTIVDSSAEKTGKLISRGDTDVLVSGGTYHPLSEQRKHHKSKPEN